MQANFQQLRAERIKAGYITEDEFKQDLAHSEEVDLLRLSPIMWTAWGHRSPTPEAHDLQLLASIPK